MVFKMGNNDLIFKVGLKKKKKKKMDIYNTVISFKKERAERGQKSSLESKIILFLFGNNKI